MSQYTIGSCLHWARGILSLQHSASLDSQILLSEVLGVTRAHVLARPDEAVEEGMNVDFRGLVHDRARGIPLAYLLGRREWAGLDLVVTPDVLVPRPETELMLEELVRMVAETDASTVADIGTGSGAIAVTVAHRFSNLTVLATDISERALRVASLNARRLCVDERVRFLHGDLLAPVAQKPDLIAANLPYLSTAMMEELDRDVRSEPALALHGGPTGQELYERLFRQLSSRGWSVPLIVESDPRLVEGLYERASRYFPGSTIRILKDYSEWDRFVIVKP